MYRYESNIYFCRLIKSCLSDFYWINSNFFLNFSAFCSMFSIFFIEPKYLQIYKKILLDKQTTIVHIVSFLFRLSGIARI